MWTLDEVKGITLNSPNVLLNEMSPEEREAHMAEYKRGGPAGRPAEAPRLSDRRLRRPVRLAGRPRRSGHDAMGKTHTVRFEPVGIEIEVDEDETILNAAFRQGIMLMHGCKEGQCSACKSFLLDGEVDLDRYSTFALPDFEEAEGWTLLCRAHAYSDLEIELINYDEEILHGGVPPRTVDRGVEAVEALTHDIRRLVLKPRRAVRVQARASTSTSRSPAPTASTARSRWPTLPGEPGHLEFMIKLYQGGQFSGLLADGDGSRPATSSRSPGPTGSSRCATSSPRRLLFIGGGAGMAPILVAAAVDGRDGHRAPGASTTTARADRGRPVPPRGARPS